MNAQPFQRVLGVDESGSKILESITPSMRAWYHRNIIYRKDLVPFNPDFISMVGIPSLLYCPWGLWHQTRWETVGLSSGVRNPHVFAKWPPCEKRV